MKQIILDAGPLIGLFYARDTYHTDCVNGFEQLAQQKTILLTPIPIIFEVYKWLLQRTRPEVAQHTLHSKLGQDMSNKSSEISKILSLIIVIKF